MFVMFPRERKVMKNISKKLILLTIPFLVMGCAEIGTSSSSRKKRSSSSSAQSSRSSKSSSSSKQSSPSSIHEHTWSEAWDYDETNHWHSCTDASCNEKQPGSNAAHVLSDEWTSYDPSLLAGDKVKSTSIKIKKCQTCDYFIVKDDDTTPILPELRFTFDPEGENADFATKATKSDLSRPEVMGTLTITNCDSKYQKANLPFGMKVRGNQTAGWAKKGFRLKSPEAKMNLLGLNKGKEFKKWVLFADAKDTTLSRSALGLYISRAICKSESQIWVSDFTPVTLYLNDEYWGYYYLAEQKEVKSGRVKYAAAVDEEYTGIDIGYTFELDHYADSAGSPDEASELKKGADGDPTFRMKYIPDMKRGSPSGPLAAGQICTYTMLSDITDGPTDEHVQADYDNVNTSTGVPMNNANKTSNSAQLTFIRDRMEALYQVLYQAAINNTAKDIDENNQVINTTLTPQQAMAKNFDLDAWVDGYIISAFVCPPDLGYSSFYMSFDNQPNGDKKLRFDVPWDFDSNFGNRNSFYVDGRTDTYVENTYNTWLYLLSKLSFFNDMVKVKWNKLRNDKVFEGLFRLARCYYAAFDAEIRKNHEKWPQNDAAHQPPNNFNEIRDPYKNPSQYKEAEAETINWCAKRINYLESRWGIGRPDIKTTI